MYDSIEEYIEALNKNWDGGLLEQEEEEDGEGREGPR